MLTVQHVQNMCEIHTKVLQGNLKGLGFLLYQYIGSKMIQNYF